MKFRRTSILAITMTAGLAITPAVFAQQNRDNRQDSQRQEQRDQNRDRQPGERTDRQNQQPRVAPGGVDRVDIITARFLPLTLAEDMEGAEIVGTDGKTIGHLRDMVVHARTGEINIALIGRGGVGSLGETYYGVPVEALRWNPAEKQFAVNFTEEQIKNAKGFDDKDDWGMTVGEAYHSQTSRALGINNSRHWQDRMSQPDRYTESFRDGKYETITGEVLGVERSDDPQTRGDHVIRLRTERGDTVRVIADTEPQMEKWREQRRDEWDNRDGMERDRDAMNRDGNRSNTRDDRNALPDRDRDFERDRAQDSNRDRLNQDRDRDNNARDREARNQEGRQDGMTNRGQNERGDWTPPAYLPRQGQKITVKGVPTKSSEGRTIVASQITSADDNRTRQYRNEEGRPWWNFWDENERAEDMHQGHALLSDIRDANVITSDGESVGELADIGIEPSSMTIGMTTVEVGGVMGLGGEKVIVPLPAFRFNKDMDLQIAKTKAELETAPKVKVEGGDEHFGPVLVQAQSYTFYNVPLPNYDRGPRGNPAQHMRDGDREHLNRDRINNRDANQDRDNEAWRQMRAGGLPVNIAGEIDSIDREQSIKSLGEGVVITLDDGNKQRTVHLGHRERLDGLGVKLNEGDRVSVRGAEVTLDGKVFVLAETITVNGRDYQIRTQELSEPAKREYNPGREGDTKDKKDQKNDPTRPR